MKKLTKSLLCIGLLASSQSVWAYPQCEGLWDNHGFLLKFNETAFHCKWGVWNEMFPENRTVLTNPGQEVLFSVESRDAAAGYNSRFSIPNITGQFNIAPKDMDGVMVVRITSLPEVERPLYNGHKVFFVSENPTGDLKKIGVIFDAKIVTVNGTVNSDYQPISAQDQKISNFSWRNRQDEQYGLRIKATYILLDPSFQGTVNVPVAGSVMKAKLQSQGSNIEIRTDDARAQNLKINAFSLKIIPRFKTCGVVGDKDINVSLPPIKKRELQTKGKNSTKSAQFTLKVKCEMGASGQYAKFFVTFSDMQSGAVNNGSSDYLKTVQGEGYAKGVSLRIVDANKDKNVVYGPVSRSKNSATISLPEDPQGNAASNPFNVYYVNDGSGPNGQVTSGAVRGIAAYTFSYE